MAEQSLCPVLVGRDAELSLLEDALLAAHRGDGGVVVVSGDAGAGKSRLAAELERRAARLGMTVMHGGCSEADLALPYLPFLEAVGNHLAEVDLGVVREELGPVRRELAALFPQLEPDATPTTATDTGQKLRLFEALLSLLNIDARRSGVLLVIEDVHWADTSTRELLDYFTRRLPGNRILLLVNYRGDEMHRRHPLLPVVQGWKRSRLARVVELAPLTSAQVGSMVAAIFDTDEVTSEFSDFLHQRTEGNPFVLEEMLKEAIDSGAIYRTPDRWERKELAEFRVPPTVADSIMLRVDRLDAQAAEVLRAAAVLGRSFDYQLLEAMTGLSGTDVVAALRSCVQEQLLEEETGGTGRYRFRHAITRESVYDDLILPERQRLHEQAAAALTARPGSTAVDRATHLVAAGRWEEAVPACLEAADVSLRAFAYHDGAELMERALPHLVDPAARADVLLRTGEAYLAAGEPDTGLRYVEQGIPHLESVADRVGVAHWRLVAARCHWEAGRTEVARQMYEEIRKTLEPDGPSKDLAIAYLRLAGLRGFAYDGAGALPLADRAIEIATAVGADLERIWAYNFRGLGLYMLGHYDEGLAEMDRSLREGLVAGYDGIAANALHNGCVTRFNVLRGAELDALLAEHSARLGPLLWSGVGLDFLRGRAARATGRLAEAERRFRDVETNAVVTDRTAALLAWAARERGEVLVQLGRTADAAQALRSSQREEELQDRLPMLYNWLALALVEADRDVALTHADQLVGSGLLAREPEALVAAIEAYLLADRVADARAALAQGEPDRPGFGRWAAGLVAAADGEPAEAARLLRTAAADFVAARYPVEEAAVRVRLAGLLAETAPEDAREELARADALVRQTGADRFRAEIDRLAPVLGYLAAEPDVGAAEPGPPVGERLVTVLFADVRGYTEMTATTAPAEMQDRVGTFQRWAKQEVERQHGIVDKFAGDAVMATFNVSGTSVDHAARALHAAIALQDKAALMGLQVGVGIAVGPAIVGALTPGANTSVIGDTTNRAARLQAQAGAGELVLDEEAHRRLTDRLSTAGRAAGRVELELKGFPAPVTAYRVRAG